MLYFTNICCQRKSGENLQNLHCASDEDNTIPTGAFTRLLSSVPSLKAGTFQKRSLLSCSSQVSSHKDLPAWNIQFSCGLLLRVFSRFSAGSFNKSWLPLYLSMQALSCSYSTVWWHPGQRLIVLVRSGKAQDKTSLSSLFHPNLWKNSICGKQKEKKLKSKWRPNSWGQDSFFRTNFHTNS